MSYEYYEYKVDFLPDGKEASATFTNTQKMLDSDIRENLSVGWEPYLLNDTFIIYRRPNWGQAPL